LPKYGPLLPPHLRELAASGIGREQAEAAGLYSESNPDTIAWLLGWDHQADSLGTCLVVPYLDRHGNPTGYVRLKPGWPRTETRPGGSQRKVKYEAPRGSSPRVYVPPGSRDAVNHPTADLVLTEGEKKALCGDAHGFPCMGLSGAGRTHLERLTV
jgi:hypothetical protein